MAGANPSFASEKDTCKDRQAPKCDEEAGRRRRLGAEYTVRNLLAGRNEVHRLLQRRRHGEAQIGSLGRRTEARSQKNWATGSKGPRHQRNFGSDTEESCRTL